jgi:hypothetical protein
MSASDIGKKRRAPVEETNFNKISKDENKNKKKSNDLPKKN